MTMRLKSGKRNIKAWVPNADSVVICNKINIIENKRIALHSGPRAQ